MSRARIHGVRSKKNRGGMNMGNIAQRNVIWRVTRGSMKIL